MSDAAPGAVQRIGVLVSGRGSNLQALIDAVASGRLRATIALVVSNMDEAPALERAAAAGIATRVLSHRAYASRQAFDEALAGVLVEHDVALVCLAGFMRRLSGRFFECFTRPVLNVHPSLLPAFPGVDAPAQALAHGVCIAGCTVHLATEALDAGPIVLQAAVPVLATDTVDTLAARILVEEHRLLPAAVQLLLDTPWRVDGRRFVRAAVTV